MYRVGSKFGEQEREREFGGRRERERERVRKKEGESLDGKGRMEELVGREGIEWGKSEEGGVTKFRGGQKWEEQKRISGENVGREEGECWEEGRSEKGESWERGDRS